MATEAKDYLLKYAITLPINNHIYATHEFTAYSEAQAGAFIRLIRDMVIESGCTIEGPWLDGKRFDWQAI